MTKKELFDQIQKKKSYLCVGLDPDINKIPSFLKREDNPILTFNKRIIDATIDFAVAYKPNVAFYECLGAEGWDILAATEEYLPSEVFSIADAKRGDIGNTSKRYTRAFFESMDFDAITVAPYMGSDSVKPFLVEGKWTILLALTSNGGALDFQNLQADGKQFYEHVIEKSQSWTSDRQLMYVVGATRGESIGEVRKLAPDHFLLVPGVGAQGGDLETVSRYGMNAECGLLVNSARGIIYAANDEDFDKAASKAAKQLQEQMNQMLDRFLPN